jgi:hypothetical protein
MVQPHGQHMARGSSQSGSTIIITFIPASAGFVMKSMVVHPQDPMKLLMRPSSLDV